MPAYARKSRSSNYRASLKLEGFTVSSSPSKTTSPKAKVLAKYAKTAKA
ncbi:YhfG family protein [Teredinibacter turnerae]